jgi:hypothetical protein
MVGGGAQVGRIGEVMDLDSCPGRSDGAAGARAGTQRKIRFVIGADRYCG